MIFAIEDTPSTDEKRRNNESLGDEPEMLLILICK